MTEENEDRILNCAVWATKWTVIIAALAFVALVGYVLVTDAPKAHPCSCECKNNA